MIFSFADMPASVARCNPAGDISVYRTDELGGARLTAILEMIICRLLGRYFN
ncbi:MAG: hypothetical protein AB7V46_20945 [Thermomicrobiales bacterium]